MQKIHQIYLTRRSFLLLTFSPCPDNTLAYNTRSGLILASQTSPQTNLRAKPKKYDIFDEFGDYED